MHIVAGILFALLASFANQPAQQPEWCRSLPRPEYRKLERVTVPGKWFEVYRIRPGIFAIYEPHQQEEVISYLILGKKRALLFDTGMGISNIKKLVEGLTDLPVSVVNSHTHNDHVGDNWRFSDIYGMDTAFTHESAKGSTADAQAEITPDAICGPLPAGFDTKTYATRPFHITHWLHGGEKIDLRGRVLQVIPTPGHTPDSISLWDAQNKLLFTGDTYYPGPIFLYRPETDLDAYVASIKKMNALGAKLLLPAHNVPVADPADLPRVLAAMEQIRSGKIKPVKVGNKVEYKFQGFSFLMK
ncbi:MAG TPA: MBL fold metallo-hydrolase [Candidatus Angelobacter sp.]|nr:MBL fold metallo-hydrolase [Candidatus Angelobacter sp.]